MDIPFLIRIDALLISLALLMAMILIFFVGRSLRKLWGFPDEESKGGISVVQTATFGLYGFILAFAFSMSGSRFDYVRDVFIEESNTIGTAVLRADLYSDSARSLFRKYFKEYIQIRADLYKNLNDTGRLRAKMRGMQIEQENLWNLATSQSKQPNMLIPSNQMIPALNEMFDMAEKRDILLRSNVPVAVVYMLLILALVSTFIAGITSQKIGTRERIIIAFFIVFTAMVIYMTLDMGRPLRGHISPVAAEKSIEDQLKLFDK